MYAPKKFPDGISDKLCFRIAFYQFKAFFVSQGVEGVLYKGRLICQIKVICKNSHMGNYTIPATTEDCLLLTQLTLPCRTDINPHERRQKLINTFLMAPTLIQ